MTDAPAEDDVPTAEADGFWDEHGPWEEIAEGSVEDDLWERRIRAAAMSVGSRSGIPLGLRRYLREVEAAPKTNWKLILQDFIRRDRSDYTFARPDRRYQGDIIMPSFRENVFGERIDRLWFLIDTSGSISDEVLAAAFSQILQALEQFDSLSGELAFFDTEVSEFTPFESVEDLEEIVPVGGGGTSFYPIFEKLEERISCDDPPTAIIILTDGFASFPAEEAAMGVPVLWILTEDGAEPPWGVCVRL